MRCGCRCSETLLAAVQIDGRDALAGLHQGNSDVQGGGGFARSALLVAQHNDVRRARLPLTGLQQHDRAPVDIFKFRASAVKSIAHYHSGIVWVPGFIMNPMPGSAFVIDRTFGGYLSARCQAGMSTEAVHSFSACFPVAQDHTCGEPSIGGRCSIAQRMRTLSLEPCLRIQTCRSAQVSTSAPSVPWVR